jgi:bla regulator protein blaR1
MKTEKKLRTTRTLRLFLILPIIAITIIVYSSCGTSNNTELAETEIAPPPPPPLPSKSSDSVIIEADEMPQFPGGETGLMTYIANNTIYPEEAKKNSIFGKVSVKFVVEKNCSISHVEVIKSVDPLLDAEAVRVVSSLPLFEKPAKKAGEPVSVEYTIPINFNLK